MRKLTDEEVVARLTAIRGIGRWTAEMFLMFALRRPDVLSLGDAGLRRAARNLYGKRFSAMMPKSCKKPETLASVAHHCLPPPVAVFVKNIKFLFRLPG